MATASSRSRARDPVLHGGSDGHLARGSRGADLSGRVGDQVLDRLEPSERTTELGPLRTRGRSSTRSAVSIAPQVCAVLASAPRSNHSRARPCRTGTTGSRGRSRSKRTRVARFVREVVSLRDAAAVQRDERTRRRRPRCVPRTTTASQSLAQGTRSTVPGDGDRPRRRPARSTTSHVPEVSGPVGSVELRSRPAATRPAGRSRRSGTGAAYSAAAERTTAASAIPAPLPPADTGLLRSVSPDLRQGLPERRRRTGWLSAGRSGPRRQACRRWSRQASSGHGGRPRRASPVRSGRALIAVPVLWP